MAPYRRRRPRPVRGRLPGTGNKKPPPSGPKTPWERGQRAGEAILKKLNPFD